MGNPRRLSIMGNLRRLSLWAITGDSHCGQSPETVNDRHSQEIVNYGESPETVNEMQSPEIVNYGQSLDPVNYNEDG